MGRRRKDRQAGAPSERTIIRVASRDVPYAMIANEMLRDTRISREATGVLAFILTWPDDWHVTFEWLRRKLGIGRDRMRRIIGELVAAGYCDRTRARNPDGTMGSYEYVFTDDPAGAAPQLQSGSPVTGGPAPDHRPQTKRERSKDGYESGAPVENRRAADRSVNKGSDDGRKPARLLRFVSEAALDRVRTIAPGWDRQLLLRKFIEDRNRGDLSHLRDPDKAFVGWIERYTKGRPPGAPDEAAA